MNRLTHEEICYRTYDGPVPLHALAAARARDAEERSRGAAAAPEEAPARPRGTVRRMAELMVERMAGDGACSEDDLVAGGFAADEIKRHRGAAASLAARLSRDRKPGAKR
jgi:hypothetical protein